MAVEDAETRLRQLFEASIALTAELSVDALLRKLVDTAADVTGARYVALEVLDETGAAAERFVAAGADDAPPRSAGVLAVPVMLRGVAYGNLRLAGKRSGERFAEEDEEIVTLLAAQAAVGIDNARLYESATRWSRQLETLHEIVRSIVDETDVERLLQLVCARLRELTDARLALAALGRDDGDDLHVVAADSDEPETAAALIGHRIARGHSKMGVVLERRQSARVDSLVDDPDVAQPETRAMGARTGLYVPLVAHGRALGVLAVHDKHTASGRFTDGDQRLAEIFAGRTGVAVALSQRVARDTVRRVVAAQEAERRRLALELHDETGQALTSILLGLKAIGRAKSKEEAERAEADVRALVVQALQDVRALAVELRPSALDDFGLGPAVERLAETFAERSGIETTVLATLEGRLRPEVETVLYRVVQEALSNVVKHAGADRVSIVIGRRDGTVAATIDDDGSGFDPAEVREDALGLLGMRERLALVGGTLEIESTPGGGTTVAAQVPLTAAE